MPEKYFDFSGRGARSEYWVFHLYTVLMNSVSSQLAETLWGKFTAEYVSLGVILVLLTPTLAAGARRLHDIGRSGWWQMLLIIPMSPFVFLTDGQWDYLETTGYKELNAVNAYILLLILIYLAVAVLLWLYWFTKKGNPNKNQYN